MPHLRELVKLHKDEPFALIGVNSGDSLSSYKEGLEKHDVSWISAWQDGSEALNKIYQVRAFPTYVLIDHEGNIVSAGGKPFDRQIEELIDKAKD